MMKKLFLYDFKEITRILKWFYPVALGFALLTRFFKLFEDIQAFFIIESILAGFTYSAVATVLVNTFVHIIRAFLTNFYRDESYLTHTLPVEKKTLYYAFSLSSLAVGFIGIAVSLLSVFIVLYTPELFETIRLLIEASLGAFATPSGVIVALVIIVIFGELLFYLFLILTALIKGYGFNRQRGLKAATYGALYYGLSLLLTVALLAISSLGSLIFTGQGLGIFETVMPERAFITALVVACVSYLGSTAALILYGKHLFEKGVNVD